MIRIQVPATSANLGSGFDALGIALTLYNQVWMEEEDGIFISSRDGLDVPTGEDNLIYWAAKQLYDECGAKLPGLRIEQQSDIPIVNLANRLEGHPDNTTPAVLGGLVASAVENRRVYSVSVPVAPKIRFAVLIPPFELKTEVARGVLPQEVSRQNAVYNLSRSALITASLFSGSLENLRVAVQDTLHQPYRAHFIPGMEQVFRITYELGSYGTYISGAGPSIIAIIGDEVSQDFEKYAIARLEEKEISGWQLKILKSDSHGAAVFLD